MLRRKGGLVLSGIWWMISSASAANLKVQLEGSRVRLLSSRWAVTLEAGVVTGIENRLTGEIFTSPAGGVPAALPYGLGVQTGAVEEARRLHSPWGTSDLSQGETDPTGQFPSQHRPHAGSQVKITRLKDGVVMSYRGLAAAGKVYPEESFQLAARFEAGSGALVLVASGQGTGGVYGAALGVANLNKSLKATVSHMGGMTFDAVWPTGQYTLGDGGPFLEAPVIALESRRGAVAVWAQDSLFRPKNLFWQNTPGAFNLIWQTRNIMPFAPQKEATSVAWRLNCFQGSWVAALEPYRDWFQKTFAEDIKARPAWSKKIRVIVPQLPLSEESMKKLAAVFDPATVLLHAWAARKPNFDTELPDFTPREEFIRSVESAHRLGFRTSAYVNAVCINKDARVTEEYRLRQCVLLRGRLFDEKKPSWDDYKLGSIIYTDPLSPGWRKLHARLMKEFVEKTKVDSLYEDCAGTCGDFGNGIVDGLAPLQGTYYLLKETRQAVGPEIAFSSEYHVERTAPFVTWALHGTAWGHQPFLEKRVVRGRPVNNFIWGPDVLTWIHGDSVDLADVLGGIMPVSTLWLEATRGEGAYHVFRAKLMAEKQLKPAYPKTPWEKDVLAYYQDSQGNLYRLLERSGHILLDQKGREVYRRTRGLVRVKTTLALRGWPAYDQDGPIGLDPDWQYCLVPGPREETLLRVKSLTDGVYIRGYREGKGFILLSLSPIKSWKTSGQARMEYLMKTGVFRTFVNGKEVTPERKNEGWLLEAPLEATIVFLTGEAEKPAADGLLGEVDDQGDIVPGKGPELVLEMARGKLLQVPFKVPGEGKSLPGYLAAVPDG
ncbi:MAG TPA: DUF6259 domain-containing protein, partial [bacterium]|nr:DUF6259 domain-containing protein [bacterium]